MFENYSLADLFANLYKKWKINVVALVVVFLAIAVPYTFRTLNHRTEVRDTTNYSSYLMYKIDEPEITAQVIVSNNLRGYSDFYSRLVTSNLNGAFLFNDVSKEDMKKIADDLDTNETTLKNSNYDFWNKKIEVYALNGDAGVTVKILTPSKFANELIERKLDNLMKEYNNTYQDVTVSKLTTVNSQELAAGTSTSVGISRASLLLRLAVFAIGAVFVVLLANVAVYIFNPTVNRAGDYGKYGIEFVMTLGTQETVKELVNYKAAQSKLVILSSNEKVLAKFIKEYPDVLSDSIVTSNVNHIHEWLNVDKVLFVEEYGVTRYKNFEETLQTVNNLNKEILGVATYKL